MGLLKRIIRRSTSKLLGGQRHSQRLVLNSNCSVIPAQVQDSNSIFANAHNTLVKSSYGKSSHSRKSKSSRKHQMKKSSREAALLLAAKNYLPPVQFHHVHGKTAQLSGDNFVARRTSTYCQAIVFSNRIILPNERVYIKVLELAKGWNGTIRFGFTSVDPATLSVKMPKHVCPDMTSAKHTWARALADEVVRKNSIIHFSYDKQGFIHYGINNQDCGIFCANVNTSQHLWFVVDIYGLTAAIELIDPRARSTVPTRNASLDLSALSEDDWHTLAMADPHTIFKTTGAMPGEHTAPNAGRSHRRSIATSRSSFRRRFGAAPRSHFFTDHLKFSLSSGSHRLAPAQTDDYLPNIHSAMFPVAQQNIYSPMPNNSNNITINSNNNNGNTIRQQQARDAHDYYQIMSNQQQQQQQHSHYSTYADSNYHYYRSQQAAQATPSGPTTTTATPTNASLETSTNSFQPNVSSIQHQQSNQLVQSISPSNRRATKASSRMATISDEQQEHQQICHQLDGLQLSAVSSASSDMNVSQSHQQQQSKSSLSTTAVSSGAPVAATRKRLQNVTNSNSTSSSSGSTKTKPQSNSQASNKSSKSRGFKSTNATSSISNNQNNQPPPTKDCPICFERPINCVLYQCGHMCTCYECGVKQWRTQSRTCPICRTVIKDVIKTYMS